MVAHTSLVVGLSWVREAQRLRILEYLYSPLWGAMMAEAILQLTCSI